MAKHENGLTAREALARLGVVLDGEGVTWVDLVYDRTLQRPLLDRLADETWHATGWKVSGTFRNPPGMPVGKSRASPGARVSSIR